MSTKDRMHKEVYRLREFLGDKDPIACNETGSGWNNQKHENCVAVLLTIRRLAKKHHRLAEMECNGEGIIRGVHYYNGTIDDYARSIYGQGVRSAFVGEENNVFDLEAEKIAEKIEALIKQLPGNGWRVEFQGDPRGCTVRVFYAERYIDVNF